MYVRLTTLHGDKGTVDAGVAYAEGTARAAIEAAPGNRGFATFTDAPSGVVVGASYWDSAAARAASETALADLRAGFGAAGGGDITFENYDAAVVKRLSIPAEGAIVRIIRAQVDPGQVDALIAFYRSDLLGLLTSPAGVCSAQLLVDRATGKGLGITSWNDEAALAGARPILEQAGTSSQAHVRSLRFAGTEVYAMVRTTVRMD
jgi:hypothetical protein